MNEPLQGNFDGIGVQFNMLEDTLVVIQPVAKGPSEKVGILAGDRIVSVNDTAIAGVKMKRKQFMKGISQIAQEGAIQIFQEFNTGMEEIIVGVVGVLQFEVLQYRLENEYNVEIRMEQLPYEHVRWIENKDIDVAALSVTSDTKKVKDLHDRPLLLFTHPWSVQTALDRNEGLQLSEFGATEE